MLITYLLLPLVARVGVTNPAASAMVIPVPREMSSVISRTTASPVSFNASVMALSKSCAMRSALRVSRIKSPTSRSIFTVHLDPCPDEAQLALAARQEGWAEHQQ